MLEGFGVTITGDQKTAGARDTQRVTQRDRRMSEPMRQIFGQHHKLNSSEQASLWSTCIFAFDANCLLNIYRYADSTRADLFRVLEGMKGRIWVPYQAAKEFYKNRVMVIRDQKGK